MGTRLELQSLLEVLLGSENVYFQPPADKQIAYPAIVYRLDGVDAKFADNIPYRRRKRYLVTIIDRDPDSGVPDKVGALPLTRFSRAYAAKNLNHFVIVLYY